MKVFPLLLIALFLFGCASSGEVSQVKQDVSSVYTEQTNFMQKTDARLSRLEKAVGSPEAGLRKQVVDLSVASENRDEKVKVILGRLDELDSQLHAYWEDMKVQLRELGGERGDSQPRRRSKGRP